MPTFQGQINEEQLLQLIEYIKSLAHAEQREVPLLPGGQGRRLAMTCLCNPILQRG